MPDAHLDGVIVEHPRVWGDARGRFLEVFRTADAPAEFAQANHSLSSRGVLRGLHYHRHQADMWYLAGGRMQVALADLREPAARPAVETFVLDADEPATVYIPAGVAHGYLALTDISLVYFVTATYDPSDENGVRYDDPTLAIPWLLDGEPILSDRDRGNPPLRWDVIPAFS